MAASSLRRSSGVSLGEFGSARDVRQYALKLL